ncbi:YbhB/YbcL family Raf kinase inhibitor-like protein [Oceanospirillum sp. D5]|uniref:YbhB/YbcL family Raf kinase inhibitor-like protein n=2 Tax=Oceanospirillum sediminis TaxID=2760088 RepID=A0A839IX24_9GAMM|nr:YbhB/YbcL family Raf kinase inhibitor-like protein [Oceanospirillum sediminis]
MNNIKQQSCAATGLLRSTVLASLIVAVPVYADMSVSSSDIQPGEMMSVVHEFKGFGCQGENLSPQLSWQGAPEKTRSFAVTAYDPDAPTGSGWWHWVLVNIPSDTTDLPRGAGQPDQPPLPAGSQQFRTDYGMNEFGGACPPQGHGVHRYQFTVFALDTERLELPAEASAALVGYYLNAHKLDSVTLEALYER